MKKFAIPLPVLLLTFLLAAPAFFSPALQAQAPGGKGVVKLDPALDSIVAPDAKPEKLYEGHGTFEGPTWMRGKSGGYLIFSEIQAGVMHKLASDGTVSIFLDHIFTGSDPSLAPTGLGNDAEHLLGSNGTTLDRQGRVVFCSVGNRSVERLEKDGKRTVLADRFEGKKFNTPNDLVARSDGAVYFTDTRADLKRADGDPEKGEPFSAVHVIKNGAVRLLARDLTTPNGLAFTPDEKHLYIIESMKKLIDRYDVQPDDTIANRQTFVDMSGDSAPGGPDGMRVDKRGNVYSTGPGGLWIMSPEGKHIGTILTPEVLTNLSFGGSDGKTLYLTAFKGLYRVQLKTTGARP
jgi:gluconolactonase